jgi:hypothetical protein
MKTSKKTVWRLCGTVCVGLLAGVYGPDLLDNIRAAFPGDGLLAAALRDCALVAPAFNRLDPEDRAACYAKHPPNEVDLAVSAARPHQLDSDLIRRQQLDHYLAARNEQR